MADWTPPKEQADAQEWTPPAEHADTAPYQPGVFMSALRNLQHSATMGYDTKFNAALQAATKTGAGKGDTFGQRYDAALANENAIQAASEKNPWVAVPSQVAGSFVPGVPIAKATNAIAKGAVGLIPAIGRNMVGGAVQGGIQGSSSASSPSEIIPKTLEGATSGAEMGAAIPAVLGGAGKVLSATTKIPVIGPKISAFGENYKNLDPKATGNIGPMTVGFGAGAAGGNIAGIAGVPGGIRPEDWSSDPVSAFADSMKWGLTGAAGGKVIKTLGRAGGALEQTFKGTPPPAEVTVPPAPTPTPPVPPAGGGTTNNSYSIKVNVKGPKPVAGTENAPVEVQRQEAMKQTATPEGRAQSNTEAPAGLNMTAFEDIAPIETQSAPSTSSQAYFKDLASRSIPDNTPQISNAATKDFQAVKDAIGTGKIDFKKYDQLAQQHGYANFDEWNTENTAMINKK